MEYRKLDPFPCSLYAWFESGCCLILLRDDFRKLSSYSRQSTEPFRRGSHISNVKVDLGSRGRSWVASPDEYRLCTFLKCGYPGVSFWIVCIRKELKADFVLPGGTDISLQSVRKYDDCIRKELYADVVL